MLRPLLVFIILAASIQHAAACSCLVPFQLLQQRVCNEPDGTILFRGVVESVTFVTNPSPRFLYVMKNVKVFQDVSGAIPDAYLFGYPSEKRLELLSQTDSAACGYILTVGSKYLIDASYLMNEERFHTLACGRTQPWPTTKKEKRRLRKLLKKSDCSCPILSCDIENPPPSCSSSLLSNDDKCIRPTTPTQECSVTYRRCKRVDGVCTWLGLPSHCGASVLL